MFIFGENLARNIQCSLNAFAPDLNFYYLTLFAEKMKTVPDILGLGLNFRPIVMINTILVMPGVSSLNRLNVNDPAGENCFLLKKIKRFTIIVNFEIGINLRI